VILISINKSIWFQYRHKNNELFNILTEFYICLSKTPRQVVGLFLPLMRQLRYFAVSAAGL
jgi:hypothetical protein